MEGGNGKIGIATGMIAVICSPAEKQAGLGLNLIDCFRVQCLGCRRVYI